MIPVLRNTACPPCARAQQHSGMQSVMRPGATGPRTQRKGIPRWLIEQRRRRGEPTHLLYRHRNPTEPGENAAFRSKMTRNPRDPGGKRRELAPEMRGCKSWANERDLYRHISIYLQAVRNQLPDPRSPPRAAKCRASSPRPTRRCKEIRKHHHSICGESGESAGNPGDSQVLRTSRKWNCFSRGNAPGSTIFLTQLPCCAREFAKSETVHEGEEILPQTPFAEFPRSEFPPGKPQFRGRLSSRNWQNPLENLLRFALFGGESKSALPFQRE